LKQLLLRLKISRRWAGERGIRLIHEGCENYTKVEGNDCNY